MSKFPIVDLVGVGLNATDTVLTLPTYPVRGSKIEYEHASVLPGGQVASTVVACQTWGMSTRYVGKLGDDAAADLHRDAFARAGVETQLIAVEDAASPQSLILVDPGGERTVLCRRSDRLVLQPSELRREWVIRARALHVDGYDTGAAIQAARWAREAGIPVIGDLDEIYPGVEELVRHIDYLIVSRDFPCRFMEEPDLELALCELRQRFGCQLTAATLGEHGVLAWDGSEFHRASAFKVPVVDTTGAGDTFHAGFIYGLLQNWATSQTLDFACAAAALNCTAVGARGGIRSVKTIQELVQAGVRYDDAYCPA